MYAWVATLSPGDDTEICVELIISAITAGSAVMFDPDIVGSWVVYLSRVISCRHLSAEQNDRMVMILDSIGEEAVSVFTEVRESIYQGFWVCFCQWLAENPGPPSPLRQVCEI
jgi:hypothetical protein